MPGDPLLSRISVDQRICFGKPCIRGTRIWVGLVLDLLAAGETVESILDSYPHLVEADVRACLAYAAVLARDRFVELPMVHDE